MSVDVSIPLTTATGSGRQISSPAGVLGHLELRARHNTALSALAGELIRRDWQVLIADDALIARHPHATTLNDAQDDLDWLADTCQHADLAATASHWVDGTCTRTIDLHAPLWA